MDARCRDKNIVVFLETIMVGRGALILLERAT